MIGSRNSIRNRRALPISLRDLRRARALVLADPDIMGGAPVFRRTRVPVHMIAEFLAQGSTPAEILEGYPRLTAEMIRLAPIYAAVHPLCLTRRKQPWHNQKPLYHARRSLPPRKPARPSAQSRG